MLSTVGRADAVTTPRQDAAVTAGVGTEALIVGLSGARQNAAVAAVVGRRLVAACEQERVTRVRSTALQPGRLPNESLDAVLGSLGRNTCDIEYFVTAEPEATIPAGLPHVQVNHHCAHAATAALTAPVRTAAVLVCDSSAPGVSVWRFEGGQLTNCSWEWPGDGFARVYSECAQLLGLGQRGEHRLEALARLGAGGCTDALNDRIAYRHGCLRIAPDWRAAVLALLAQNGASNLANLASAASSFQQCLGDALVDLVQDIRAAVGCETLCLGGGLFYNTYFNTRIVEAMAYNRVFIPVNPGNAGIAAGAALAQAQGGSLCARATSPFLGPDFDSEQIKATLDNCKLRYAYLSEAQVIDTTVRALQRGALVGWFQGPMEWGHRALGNRCILADPFSRYVLDNLNGYLKQRERYRAYGLSVRQEEASRHFRVPAMSPYMELEFEPLDRARFRYVLPPGARRLRVQTIGDEPALFGDLHAAFAAATGAGVLVNTSFNGFHEPIVCTPRDAVRVFYGSGLDTLVLGHFVVQK
jgi:carbamoyltransferase